MTASPREDPVLRTGFRLDQLASAFDRVMNPRDWKAPIRSVIPAEERQVVEKAVLWFTRARPDFIELPGKPARLVVTAPGYRVATTDQEFTEHSSGGD
jgi:hypothetical protein